MYLNRRKIRPGLCQYSRSLRVSHQSGFPSDGGLLKSGYLGAAFVSRVFISGSRIKIGGGQMRIFMVAIAFGVHWDGYRVFCCYLNPSPHPPTTPSSLPWRFCVRQEPSKRIDLGLSLIGLGFWNLQGKSVGSRGGARVQGKGFLRVGGGSVRRAGVKAQGTPPSITRETWGGQRRPRPSPRA